MEWSGAQCTQRRSFKHKSILLVAWQIHLSGRMHTLKFMIKISGGVVLNTGNVRLNTVFYTRYKLTFDSLKIDFVTYLQFRSSPGNTEHLAYLLFLSF